METRKKKSFKRLFAFLMAFVMVTTLAVSAVFAAPRFSDVPEGHEFYEYIEFLAEEEIVSGYGASGKYYGPDDLLTRAQAAKMIALAAKYEDSDGKDSKFTDVDADTDMAAQIWALEEEEVVKGWGGTDEFKPDRDITRGHVAVMLQRVFKLGEGATVAEFTDLPEDDDEVKEAIEILASNDIVSGFKGTTLFKPGEPVTRGQFAKMVAGAMNLELEIVEAKALDLKNVELSFNKSKEIAKLARADVRIVDAKTGAVQIVKEVKVKGAVASVELYNALAAKATYDVEVTVGAQVLKAQFTIGDLAPVTIKADALQIVPAWEWTAVEYEVFDANGLDLTADYTPDKMTFTSPAVYADGQVHLDPGTSTVTKIQIWDGSKLLAESIEITLKAEKRKANEIAAWTIGTANWDASNYKQVTEMAFDAAAKNVKVLVLDQFEDEFFAPIEFTSLDTGIAIVDKVSGLISPVKTSGGLLPIRIDVMAAGKVALTKTVEVKINAVSKLSSIKLDPVSVTISDKDGVGENIEIEYLDQYGEEFSQTGIAFKTPTPTALELTPDAAFDGFNVKVAASAEAGTYTVRVTNGAAGALEIYAELTVKVVKAGEHVDYDVKGLLAKVDLYDAKEKEEQQATMSDLAVVPVDKDGYVTGAELEFATTKVAGKYSLVVNGIESDGVTKVEDKAIISYDDYDLNPGSYTLSVYVGTLLIKTHSFTVVDSAPATEIVFTKTAIELNYGDRAAELLSALTAVAKVGTADVGAVEVTSVEFISNATSVLDAAGNALAPGQATIYISKVNGVAFAPHYPMEVNVVRAKVYEGSFEADEVKFLVKGLGAPQTPSTLAEVKAFFATETPYGVSFNADAIRIVDDKISIVDSILSPEDWYEVKVVDGNLAIPYRITVLLDGTKTDKSLKIEMFADGDACFYRVPSVI